jgi:threonine aldolase
MKRPVDLRSDTFTLPDEGMRQAIYRAEVGNSAHGEDPSVNRLESTVADYFGVDAGLFLPSATMAGQIAFKVHTRPGDVILIEEYGHGYYFESGSMGLISGIVPRLLKGERGMLSPQLVRRAIDHLELAHGRAALAVLENTTNFGGGAVYPPTVLQELYDLSRAERLPLHIDGARIWNAIAASRPDPRTLAPPGGSLSVCFSKGLGAPMGALLLGGQAFIEEARRVQAMLGGRMRQVGFMAAAALYGFEHNLDRLVEDHANAQHMARVLAANPALAVEPSRVETNIVYFRVKAGAERAARLVAELEAGQVRAWSLGPLLRLVTSLNVDRADCDYAAHKINELLH